MTRSAQILEEVLAICLDDMQAGMTAAECLARYPESADQLKPALLAAERLQTQAWPTLSRGGRLRGRERMYDALVSRRSTGFAWWPVLRSLAVAVMLLVLAAGVWLAWPGRQRKHISLPTSAPAVLPITPAPSLTPGPTATPTLTLTLTPTMTPSATGTARESDSKLIEVESLKTLSGPDRTMTPAATATSRMRNTPTSDVQARTPELTQATTPTVTSGADQPQQTPDDDRTPDATAQPTETRAPEGSSTPSQTASATGTPRATATRKPMSTRLPTETTQPTGTPRSVPTEPPHETATHASVETPEPSKTPESTKVPRSSETSEPPKTPDHD